MRYGPIALVAALTIAASTPAFAVDARVASACAGDYLALCSQHDPDSPGVRRCFKAKGSSLSSRCLTALVAAGEISQSEVERKSARR